MSIESLGRTLEAHLQQKKPVSSEMLQDHFANLMLEPSGIDPKVPSELSDALRACILENDPVNRVYETIDRILSLKSDPAGIWEEVRAVTEEYSDRSLPYRLSKVSNGTTLKTCFRIVSYLKMQGFVSNVGEFLAQIEEAFSQSGGKIEHHNQLAFLAADLYTDLLVFGGYAEDLKEMFGIRSSKYVVRAVGE